MKLEGTSTGWTKTLHFITQDGGGSGIFFTAGAINLGDGMYKGTNAMLIGDRIAADTSIKI